MPRIPSCRLLARAAQRRSHRRSFLSRLAVLLALALSLVSLSNAEAQLKVNPANPRYFLDASGQSVYLTGAHVNNSLVDRSDKPVFDFTSYLDFLQRYNHNFVRLWVWEQAAWTHESTAKIEFDPLPYQRTGPGTALDGKPKFDLSRFNQIYFDRLRARVIAAKERGIYVSVMLFQGFSSQPKSGTANPWPGHPFHSSNNINAINGDPDRSGSGEEVHSLSVPSITKLQEAYVRNVVDTLNDLDNVLYEVSGEAPLSSKDWQYHMINYLKSYQATKSKQHPVGISYFYNGDGSELIESPADWILFLGIDRNPPIAAGDKVLLLDPTQAILSGGTAYQWVWKSFMRGFNPIYPVSDLANAIADERAFNALGWALNIAQSADVSSMLPSDIICSTGYCLVERGLEYLAYVPSGAVRVNLSGANRDFLVTWFDPTTGQTISGGTIRGGNRVQLTSPVAGDAVLHLLATDVESPQSSTASAPFDFSLSNSGPVSISQGSSAAATISLNFASKTSTVNFSLAGIPQGTTASLSKTSCKTNCSTVLTLNASASATPGTYPVTATGKSNKGQKTTSFNLTVASPATVQPPVISPNGGTYTSPVAVTMATATTGAAIYYTTDGATPTNASRLYSGPITLTASAVVKGKAFKTSAASSETGASFTLASPLDFSLSNSGNKSVTAGSSVTNSIIASLTSGSTQTVSFSASGLPSGATASFSTASCSPSCSTVLTIATSGSTPAGNFSVTVTSTGGGVTKTTAFTLSVSAVVVSTVATPTITPNGASFTSSVSVTMATSTSGASIYYTTNGTSPTQSSTLYTGAMTLTSSAVVKAKAFKSGYNASTEASASFTQATTGTVTPGLVAYWKFDEGTGATAADSSGNGNSGTLTNGPAWASGIVGNALSFDGIDDNVTVADSNSLDLTNSFTLSAWVNPASAFTDFRSILAKNYKYYLYASSTGYCGDGSALGGFYEVMDTVVCQPSSLPVNTWTHLTLTYNDSVLTLYRNGSAVATANVSGTVSPSIGTLQIGASEYGEYFQGLIDEVRVYNRVLTNTEIQTIYQQAAVTLPFNYTISNSGDKSVNAGSLVTNSISASLVSGTSQAASFSVSGLPSGATGSFSAGSCTLACSTVITINTSGSTPAGNFPITITATGGGVQRTTIFTLSVTFALTVATPTLTPNGGSFSSSVSVAMQSATAGSSIYYTTDGSTPTQSSTLYTGAMTLTSSATVNAAAFKSGYNSSAVASASFTGTTGTGRIYFVATNGNDAYSCAQAQGQSSPKRTLNAAFSCMASGDTVQIKAGTYAAPTTMPPSGTSWSSPTTIQRFGSDVVTITVAAGGISLTNRSYMVWDGVNVTGAGTADQAIWLGTNTHHIRIINSDICCTAAFGIQDSPGNGAMGSFEITNNIFHDIGSLFTHHGVYFGTPDNLIERNEFYAIAGGCVHLYTGDSRFKTDNTRIRFNWCHDTGGRNRSSTQNAGFIVWDGSNRQIYGNIISNLDGVGMNVRGAQDKIYNNTSYNNKGFAISLEGSGHDVKNNIFWQNCAGDTTCAGWPYPIFGPGDRSSGSIKSNNLCDRAETGCAMTSDPLFVTPSLNNFRLQSGSPAIGKGVNLLAEGVNFDFDGIAFPQASAFDIGAFKYVPLQ